MITQAVDTITQAVYMITQAVYMITQAVYMITQAVDMISQPHTLRIPYVNIISKVEATLIYEIVNYENNLQHIPVSTVHC